MYLGRNILPGEDGCRRKVPRSSFKGSNFGMKMVTKMSEFSVA